MGTIYRNGIPFVGSGGAGGVELTQAEYDALPTSEKMNGAIYFISDGEASYPSASTMRYDNSTSGLTATSVQAAVDEVNGKVNDNISSINSILNNSDWENKHYSGSANDAIKTGIYYIFGGSDVPHPEDPYGILITFFSDGVLQFYCHYTGSLYYRIKSLGNWSSWAMFTTSA